VAGVCARKMYALFDPKMEAREKRKDENKDVYTTDEKKPRKIKIIERKTRNERRRERVLTP